MAQYIIKTALIVYCNMRERIVLVQRIQFLDYSSSVFTRYLLTFCINIPPDPALKATNAI